jgi:hypothetical protein
LFLSLYFAFFAGAAVGAGAGTAVGTGVAAGFMPNIALIFLFTFAMKESGVAVGSGVGTTVATAVGAAFGALAAVAIDANIVNAKITATNVMIVFFIIFHLLFKMNLIKCNIWGSRRPFQYRNQTSIEYNTTGEVCQ